LSDTQAKKPRANPGDVVAIIRRVLSENGRDYVWHYAFAVACMLTIAATTAFMAWIMRDVVDQLFAAQRQDLIVVIAGAIMLTFTIRGFASYAQTIVLAKVGNNLVARYQRRVFEHLMKLDIGFFTATRSGQLAARIAENVAGIRDLLSLTLTAIARDAVSLVGLLAVMLMQDLVLSMIALLIGPPIVFAVNYLMRRLRRATREAVEVNSRLLGAIQESTQGIQIVKAFTMEGLLARKIDTLIGNAEQRANRIARVSERMTPITEMLAGAAIAGVIGYAGYRASVDQQPPGAVISFITALLLAYDPARRLARVQVNIERSLVNARMIYEILDIKPQQADRPGATELKAPKGEVRFRDVSFAYAADTPVLRNVSFTAQAGKTTAIVGPSGAGKSTLVSLLEHFYDPTGGIIEIDGQDIAKVTKASLRGQIAYVSQQPCLFEGSIRDNIRYGRPDATDAEIEEAARLAQATDFIAQQPRGWDTMVGENGATLSGGQRQRLSIARAIVRNAPVLLLDEATSALDNESEQKVQKALEQVMKGRTTLVIAHRLSTVINADRIIVMDDGRVVEQGSHLELVELDGIYARFHFLQGDRKSAPKPARPGARKRIVGEKT
jgi:subfamily B ATP-binding cassette protein MsbA